jgi:FAD/FMN-containing dehydrogenase
LVERNDLGTNRICVKGGTRIRDVVKLLLDKGLAFKALPSHDAQSIGGILSTDVHGTGRDWGFVNESIVSLKLIDGKGDVHECRPENDLFKAAIGGIGAVGIISEVVVEAVPRFAVQQKFEMSTLGFVEENLDRLLQKNEHLSLYLFPFTDKCQISTWNRTDKKKSFLGPVREFVSISKDALLSAWFGNFMAYTGLLPKLSDFTYGFKRGTNLVMESNKAFNRTIYHLHQELEFTVPFEVTFEECKRFIELYEKMYGDGGLPYTLFEIRFTPEGRNRTLIGAGRERRSTWIDLICNDSHGFEKYYAAAEKLVKEIGGRPHLGKFCHSFDADDMRRIHGEHFDKFLQLVNEYDPQRKFANVFTRRLFESLKS